MIQPTRWQNYTSSGDLDVVQHAEALQALDCM